MLSLFIGIQSKGQQAKALLLAKNTPVCYFIGTSEPDSNWYKPTFDDSRWEKDTMAIIGYGYGDKDYIKIDSNATSVYLRCPFTIENKLDLTALNLLVDFDDGYIAYINGYEVARVNIDPKIGKPTYNHTSIRSHASEYAWQITRPVLGVYLDKTTIDSCIVEGENLLAIQVIDDSLHNGLFLIANLFDLSNYNYVWSDDMGRYKRLISVDSTNLPLIKIETDEFGISYNQSIWTTAHMGIVNNVNKYNKPTDINNEYNGLISIRSRGQSSRDFAKKSYRFELIDSTGADTTFSILGMPKESDWILFGPYTDKSQIRNKFAYDLGARMGHYQPRSRFCELMINGQNEGLYMITEQIKRDKNRVDISKLDSSEIEGFEVTGGYIFKYDKTDPNSKIRIKSREIVYPDVLQPEQETYLKNYFNTYDSILKTNDFLDPEIGFRRYASDSSLVDYMIISEIIKNADSYLYSTYLHKDRDDKDGRTKFGPMWDYDLGFGNTIFQQGNVTEGWQWDVNRTMNLTRYLQDRKLVELLQNRWWELRKSTFCNDSIFNLFDQLIEQIKEVRIRNYDVWPYIDKTLFFPGYNVYSYDAEIETLRNWIETRLKWIDSNINNIYYELKLVNVSDFGFDHNLSVYPSPFNDQLRIVFNLENRSNIGIELYNMMGQRKINYQLSAASGLIDINFTENELSNLNPGMFIIKVSVNNQAIGINKVIKK